VLLLTYGAGILHGAFNAKNVMHLLTDFPRLLLFCAALFAISLRNM
jgi:ABC-2 type transport system permease protein